jgi:hypothetical protein
MCHERRTMASSLLRRPGDRPGTAGCASVLSPDCRRPNPGPQHQFHSAGADLTRPQPRIAERSASVLHTSRGLAERRSLLVRLCSTRESRCCDPSSVPRTPAFQKAVPTALASVRTATAGNRKACLQALSRWAGAGLEPATPACKTQAGVDAPNVGGALSQTWCIVAGTTTVRARPSGDLKPDNKRR